MSNKSTAADSLPSPKPSLQTFIGNLRDLPRAMTLSALLSGLLVVIIGCASSLVLLIKAGEAGGVTRPELEAWIISTVIGTGLLSIAMSLWFRQPVLAAWSTPGAALLVSVLSGYRFSDAVGAFLIAAAAVFVLGITGLFGRVMKLIPNAVVMGMLGGVLLKFGLGLFSSLPQAPILVVAMLIGYLLLRRVNFRAPTVAALVIGVFIAAVSGQVHLETVHPAITVPQLIMPTFSPAALLGLALPLFALSITAQDAPGLAVLRKGGYDADVNQILVWTGGASAIAALFGSHGITLAAITAALVTGQEAHPDKHRRYAAGVSAGMFYIVVGIFGSTAVAFFAALPAALVAATAGLGLFAALSSSIVAALDDSTMREAGLAAFLCTAANFTLFGIGAPFWGLIVGVGVHFVLHWQRDIAVQPQTETVLVEVVTAGSGDK